MTEAEIVNFFMANRDRLWAMANLILRDHHLTEDALQETLLTLLQKRESYDPSRPLLYWAFGITRNKALKIVDKSGRYSLFGEEQLQALQNALIADAGEGPAPDRRLGALRQTQGRRHRRTELQELALRHAEPLARSADAIVAFQRQQTGIRHFLALSLVARPAAGWFAQHSS